MNRSQLATPSNAPSRREFVRNVLLAGAGGAALAQSTPAHAFEPITRAHGSHMKLSLAAYSFNRFMARRGDAKSKAKATMTMPQFMDYCAELQLDGCELTAYYFPEQITNDVLLDYKQRAFRLGLDISGGAIGNDFGMAPGPERDKQLADTRAWIDYAAVLGAPHIRIFAGKQAGGDSLDTVIERSIAGINESLDYAAKKGVVLGLENHGGIAEKPEVILRIIKGVKESPWFGVNFDSGNFHTDDPYRDLALIAPYAVNVQIKASMKPNGKREPADLKRVVKILRDAGYRGYLALEYEDPEDPKQTIPGVINKLREAIAS